MTDEQREKIAKARHPSSMNPEGNAERSISLRASGRCGSLSNGGAYVCTLFAHSPETKHQQQEIGGADDGLVYAEWSW